MTKKVKVHDPAEGENGKDAGVLSVFAHFARYRSQVPLKVETKYLKNIQIACNNRLIVMKLSGIEFATTLMYKFVFIEDSMHCKVRNANYERVVAVMDRYLKEKYSSVCNCPRCISDIAALALNYLPPHYYVEQDSDRDIGSPWVMVETAVVEAIDRVTEHPNHSHMDRPVPHSADPSVAG